MRLRPQARQQTADRPAAGGERVLVVQRIGAIVVGLVILVFGVLGFANQLAFFSTEGERILGLSSNGLLSAISIVTAVVLFVAAARGPRIASTVMIVVGVLFLLSALVNLAQSGDLVMTLGAGDVTLVGPLLVDQLTVRR